MRAFIALTFAVFAAIGIGIAIEPIRGPFPVPVIAQAITKTVDVRSAEISETVAGPSIQRQQHPLSAAIYQAPNRYQGPAPMDTGDGSTIQMLVIGHVEIAVAVAGSKNRGILNELHVPISHPADQDGLTPAQSIAFLPLMDARYTTDIIRTRTGWSYKLAVPNTAGIILGGSIEIAGGYVYKATLNETFAHGPKFNLEWRYTDFNSAPPIPTPRVATLNP